VPLVGYTATRLVTALSPTQSRQGCFWPIAKASSPFLYAVRSNAVNDDEKICQSPNDMLLYLWFMKRSLLLQHAGSCYPLMYNCCTATHSLYMSTNNKICGKRNIVCVEDVGVYCTTMMREKLYNIEISVRMSERND
jgi:hypothetical protein